MIEINLPRQKVLKCESTGKRKKIKLLKDFSLFVYKDELYEKFTNGCCNLSDLDNSSEPDENEYVEVYEEIK